MKRAEFNAQLAHVHKARNRQRAIRNKISAISGPPTYVRQMANESIKKARFNAMGAIDFGNDRARRLQYETARNIANDVDISNQFTTRTSSVFDDPTIVKGGDGLDDDWSLSVKDWESDATPTNTGEIKGEELYLQVEKDLGPKASKAEVHAEYKSRFKTRYGRSARPFEQSTMMVSHIPDNLDQAGRETFAKTKQLAEVQDAITKLDKSLVVINGQIKEQEGELIAKKQELDAARKNLNYARHLQKTKPEALEPGAIGGLALLVNVLQTDYNQKSVLLNGDSNSQGLRSMAIDVRKGISALHAQRSQLMGELGVTEPAPRGIVGSAVRTTGTYAIPVAVVTYLLAMRYFTKQRGTRRGRGNNPLDIFA